ncbi:MAG: glycosyltransferase family 2 protein, partial [Christensenellales bacterium]
MIYFGVFLFVLFLVFKCMYILFPLSKRNHKNLDQKIQSFKSFALLVPAHNEESVIINCLRSLKELQYPNYSVYIIDDGSTDGTFDVVNKFLNLVPARLEEDSRLEYQPITAKYRSSVCPNFYLISKENGGKADALNAGISCCSQQIVVTLDADCFIKRDALSVMNKAFQNRRLVAAGGTVHITQSVNNEEKLIFKLKNLIRYQVIQYLNAFYLH